MRLYYLDESGGEGHYVRSAIGIDAEVWSDAFYMIREWRQYLREQHSIPLYEELHAYELLHGKGNIAWKMGKRQSLSKEDGVKIFIGGLQKLEDMAQGLLGHFEIINVSLNRQNNYNETIDVATLRRILARINKSASLSSGRYAFLIFDEGKEAKITKFYRKAFVYNPTPSKYEAWENGRQWKNIPIKNIVGGPAFRTSKSDYFIQMADFVAHALLKKDEVPTSRIKKFHIDEAFDVLDEALNKRASEDDPQGVVRY